MANPETFTINTWNQGISDDDYIGQPWTFAYGQNLNTRTNPRAITLSASPQVKLQLTSTDGSPNTILNLDEFGGTASGIMVFTTNGKIYKGWSFQYQLAAANKVILNSTVFSIGWVEYLLMFRNGFIDRISTADVQSNNWAGITEGWKTFTTSSLTTYCPVINNEGTSIIFGCADGIFVLDKFGTLTRTTLLKTGERVIGMTRTGDQLKVYTNRGDSSAQGTLHGYQYFFNTGTLASTTVADSASPSYVIEWRNLPISSVANDGDIDYIIVGLNPAYSSLYISSGYQRVLIKKKAQGTGYGQSKFNFQWNGNFMKAKNGIVYIPSTEWIYTYWEYFPGFGKTINLEYADASINSNVFWSTFDTTNMYIGHAVSQWGISYWVSTIELQAKPTYWSLSGTYYSRWITGPVVWQNKSMRQINLGYDLSGSYGGAIQIAVRRSESDSFTTFATITDTTKNNFRLFPTAETFHEFNKLQIRIILSKPNQDTVWPAVYDLSMDYDIIKL